MTIEQTLSIIKPDGVKNRHMGHVIARFEEEGVIIRAMKMVHLTRKQAEGFYAEHAARPFFGELCTFMSSGPVVLMVLEGDDMIARNRAIMGATDPADAAEGTLRRLYAGSKGENTVHGSDSPTSAAREIAYYFGRAFELV